MRILKETKCEISVEVHLFFVHLRYIERITVSKLFRADVPDTKLGAFVGRFVAKKIKSASISFKFYCGY